MDEATSLTWQAKIEHLTAQPAYNRPDGRHEGVNAPSMAGRRKHPKPKVAKRGGGVSETCKAVS